MEFIFGEETLEIKIDHTNFEVSSQQPGHYTFSTAMGRSNVGV